jgi:hypothetical protein
VACCAPLAHAQVSGSVGALSDYRYRGYSLSDGDPAVQASIAYDATNGAYAGLFASSVRHDDGNGVQWIPYAGFARRDAQGRSWDIGVRYSHFGAAREFDYAEVHAGVALRRAALRVHYAPDYFGQVSNVYFEIDGAVPFGERVRGLWHAGFSRSGARDAYVYVPRETHGEYSTRGRYERRTGDRTRIDVRAGIAIETKACDVQVAWVHVDGGETAPYALPWNPRDRAGWVLGCVKRW